MRNKILSLLVLLLTAATGAWATVPKVYTEPVAISSLHVGDILATGFSLTPASNSDAIYFDANRSKKDDSPMGSQWAVSLSDIKSYGNNAAMTFTTPSDPSSVTATPVDASGNDGNAWEVTLVGNTQGTYTIRLSGTYYDPPIEVKPVEGKTNEWTLSMPASDVVLTPIYSEATITRTVGTSETETAFASLKEAFADVKDGETIKLDWNVTLSEALTTPDRGTGDPIKFTLDLNGYVIDGLALSFAISLTNGDEMTIKDSDTDQKGGIKGSIKGENNSTIIFDGGRYGNAGNTTAQQIKDNWADAVANGWQMADGKEFVDIENAPVDNFYVRVDYAAFKMTIPVGKFATFYDNHNVKLDATQATAGVGIHTISEVSGSTAFVTPITSTVIPANTPILVYNGGTTQDVKLKVTTTDATIAGLTIAPEFKGTAIAQPFTDADMAGNFAYYVLSGGKIFVPVYEAGTIPANKCWLQIQTSAAPAQNITLVFDDNNMTGIGVVGGSAADNGDIYDLSGRKVGSSQRHTLSERTFNVQRSTLKKGVYVKDGQKVIIK